MHVHVHTYIPHTVIVHNNVHVTYCNLIALNIHTHTILYTCTVERLTVDTSTLAFVPIVAILYKTTPELRTPLQSGQLDGSNGVHNIEVPL